jgi:hypothetical protein
MVTHHGGVVWAQQQQLQSLIVFPLVGWLVFEE